MTTPSLLRYTFIRMIIGLAGGSLFVGIASAAPPETPARHDARMAWYREAKFGMFIHWGLYAIPARGEWVMNRSKIPVAEYAKLAGQFNPVRFNADEWVRVAKEAGMRYMVITSKHHDGFAMFGSKASPYNIVEATPFKRDPLKELAAACQKEGIRLGFYYSQAQDWHHPGGGVSGNKRWDPTQEGDFDEYLGGIAIPQIKELLTGYGPVAILWCDTPVGMDRPRAERVVAAVRTAQSAALINSRLMYSGRKLVELPDEQIAELRPIGVDYLSYPDRQIPGCPQWPDWETCMTLNNSWGYQKDDENWKTTATLIEQLVEITSKGGNFLLNVGPTAEGVIPPPSVERLKEVGTWLKVNGEAIYGAGPSTLPMTAKEKGAAAWRCTTKPGKLYIHLKWPAPSAAEGPGAKFELSGVKDRIEKACLLTDRQPLQFTQAGESLSVALPPTAPGDLPTVLSLDILE